MKEKGKDSVVSLGASNQTVNYTKYKASIYVICALAFLGSTAPFWHRFVDEDSTVSYLGYSNFSIFLYHFGVHFLSFTTSLFILWIIGFIPDSAKYIKKLVRGCASVFMAISLYFLLWVFMPDKFWRFMPGEGFDFPKIYYQIVLVFVSITLTYLLFNLTKASFDYIDALNNIINNLAAKVNDLKSKIRKLTSFIVFRGERHVPEGERKKKYILDYLKLFIKGSFLKTHSRPKKINLDDFFKDDTIKKISDRISKANRESLKANSIIIDKLHAKILSRLKGNKSREN